MEPDYSAGAERGHEAEGLGAKTRRGGRKRRTDGRGGASAVGEGETLDFSLPNLEAAVGAGAGSSGAGGAGAGGSFFTPRR